MAQEIAGYPTQVWDGLSRNEARVATTDEINPNPEDWNKITAELIATQTFSTFLSVDGNVGIKFIEPSTNTTLADHINHISSAGRLTGGAVTDGGSETVNVAAGKGVIRNADLPDAEIFHFDWIATTGIAIPTDTTRWVIVKFNGGSPTITTEVDHDSISHTNEFALAIVINDGGTLHVHALYDQMGDAMGLVLERFYETLPMARDERLKGLLISDTGTRNIALTAGALWDKLNRYVISAKDTSVSGSFDTFHSDGSGGFTKTTGLTQWPNTKYDDGSGTLATIGANKYAVLWFYIEVDEELVILYGSAEYNTATAAEKELAPSALPDQTLHGGRLISRLVFQESSTTPDSITSAFAEI